MNLAPLLVVLGLSTVVMLSGWMLQQRTRNPALADLCWAICISASALYYGLVAGGALLPRLLVAMMGGVGGFRLFMQLLQRMLVDTMDSRSRALRERADGRPLWMLGYFVFRGVSATLFSVPLFIAASNPEDQASRWTWLAAAVYFVGLSGEAYADIQLAKFRDQPRYRTRTCRRGLWRYSRHPNYFFALIHWCSYALLAIGLPWPLWSFTLLGPVLMALTAARRIPIIESHALQTRGEDYLAYQQATSILIPWLPKGWPKDQPANAWYTPPPPSRAQPAAGSRATPLPGARVTPSPLSRMPLAASGPETPRPQRVLERRATESSDANAASQSRAADVDS
jgi:steroid 5-alpha reductase family enzyme